MERRQAYSRLVGLFRGDPELMRGKDGHLIHDETLQLVLNMFSELGVNLRQAPGDSQRFDAVLQFEKWIIGLEVKLGTTTVGDVENMISRSDFPAESVNALMLISSDFSDRNEVESSISESHIPFLSLSCEDFITLHKLSQAQGNFNELIEDFYTRSSRPEVKYVRHYIERTFGTEFWEVLRRNDFAMEVFRKNTGIIDRSYSKIAIIGPTNAGKSSLINCLFGEEAMEVAIRTDTTDKVAKIDFPSGLVLYDTPGIGGLSDVHENITRAFLGLPQTRDLKMVSKVPVFSYAQNEVFDISVRKKSKIGRTEKDKDEELRDIDAMLFVYDITTGMRRQDAFLFNQVKRKVKRTVLIANKIDLLDDDDVKEALDPVRKNVTEDIVQIAARPKSGNPENVEELADRMFRLLSPTASVKFNDAVLGKFRRNRDIMIDDVIMKIAARSAVIKVNSETIEGVRELDALFLGMLIRLGIDFEVGGPVVKQVIVSALAEGITGLSDEIEQARTEIHIVPKRERVLRRVPMTGEGAIGGGILGGLVGLMGGPLGLVLGSILGGALGGSMGSGASKTIATVITVPVEETRIYAGGYQAAIAGISFGRALRNVLEEMETNRIEELDKQFQEGVIARFRENFDGLSRLLTDNQKDLLDSAISEEEAYDILSSARI